MGVKMKRFSKLCVALSAVALLIGGLPEQAQSQKGRMITDYTLSNIAVYRKEGIPSVPR